VRVAVAVITDDKHQVLIARRPTHTTHAGMWEFPGGKLEINESPTSALIREVKEEVGLDVKRYEYLGEVHHAYTHQQVSLQVYHVYQFEGEARPCERQLDLRWIDFAAIGDFTFPAANEKVMELVTRRLRIRTATIRERKFCSAQKIRTVTVRERTCCGGT